METFLSSTINWNTKDVEYFVFFRESFDIRKAKNIIVSKPRKIVTINVEELFRYVGLPDQNGKISFLSIAIDPSLVDKADLSIPLIMITKPTGLFCVDGWHRLAKARLEGLKELPVVVLNKKETKQIEV